MNGRRIKDFRGLVVALLVVASIAAMVPMAVGTANDPICISGYKYDNATGEGLEGWTIVVTDFINNNVIATNTTNQNGYWEICDIPVGVYVVTEVIDSSSNWVQKYPASGNYTIIIDGSDTLKGFPNSNTVELIFKNEQEEFTNPGTGTPGYWKNHPDAWPVGDITIGGITYTKDEAIANMSMPDGDKTYTMFRALVCAKLNVLIGNDDTCISETITAADAWMATYGPVGSGVKGNSDDWKEGEPLYVLLDDYNNGGLCAPSRDALEEIEDTETTTGESTAEDVQQDTEKSNGKGKGKKQKK